MRIKYRLVFAAIFFFLVKFIYVCAPVFFMETPRLGDDALMYLSKGKAFYHQYYVDSPLVQSISEQILFEDSRDDQAQKNLWRVSNQVTGTLYPLSDIFIGAIEKIPVPIKWQFAIYESFVAIVMTVAVAFFLVTFFSTETATYLLVVLGFIILPNQGLHYLVPSTLTLSCSLFLLALLSRYQLALSKYLLWMLTFVISGTHLIGKAYLILGLVHFLLNVNLKGHKKNLYVTVAIIIANIFIWKIAVKKNIFFTLPLLSATGHLSFLSGIMSNIHGAGQISLFVLTKYPFIVLPGLTLGFFKRKYLSKSFWSLYLLVFLSLTSSLFYVLDRYPAEIFSRVFVLFFLLTAGLSFASLLRISNKQIRWIFVVLFIGNGAYSSSGYFKSLKENINDRVGVFDEGKIRQFLNSIDTQASLMVYLDTEYALRINMLLGGEKFISLAPNTISEGKTLDFFLKKSSEHILVAPHYAALNSLTKSQQQFWVKKRQGFYFKNTNRLKVECPLKLCPMEGLRLYVNSLVDRDFKIYFKDKESSKSRIAELLIPPHFRGWIEVPMSSLYAGNFFFIEADPVEAWIEGITFDAVSEAVYWPWAQEAKVSFYLEDSDDVAYEIPFSTKDFFRYWGEERLTSTYRNLEVVSDGGGLVFIKGNPR